MKIVTKTIVLMTVPLLFNLALLAGITYLLKDTEDKMAVQQAEFDCARRAHRLLTNLRIAEASDKWILQERSKNKVNENVLERLSLMRDKAVQQAHLTATELNVPPSTTSVSAKESLHRRYPAIAPEKEISYASIADDLQLETRVRRPLMGGLAFNVTLTSIVALLLYTGVNRRLAVLSQSVDSYRLKRIKSRRIAGTDELREVDDELHKLIERVEDAGKHERALLELLQDIVASVTLDGFISHCNKQAIEQWEVRPKATNLFDIINPNSKDQLASFLSNCRDSEATSVTEVIIETPRGSTPFRLRGSSGGENHDVVITARDITKEVNREQAKRQLLAIVGHDLKAPLASVRVTLATVAEGVYGKISTTGLKVLSDAETTISLLLKSLKEMLDFEKMEAGKLTLDFSVYPVKELILDAAESVPGLEDRLIVDAIAEGNLWCDANRLTDSLSTILGSLASIAREKLRLTTAEFSNQMSIRISFETEIDNLEDLFNTYTANREDAGTSMAIPLARAIVRAHSGRIVSTVEEGTATIELTLPLAQKSFSGHSLVTPENYSQKHEPDGEATKMNALTSTITPFSHAKLTNEIFKGCDDDGFVARVSWWEGRRVFYNMALFLAGVPGIVLYVARGNHNFMAVGAAIVLWAIGANLGYTLGPILDVAARTLKLPVPETFAVTLMKMGWTFSVALTAIESLMAAMALI